MIKSFGVTLSDSQCFNNCKVLRITVKPAKKKKCSFDNSVSLFLAALSCSTSFDNFVGDAFYGVDG